MPTGNFENNIQRTFNDCAPLKYAPIHPSSLAAAETILRQELHFHLEASINRLMSRYYGINEIPGAREVKALLQYAPAIPSTVLTFLSDKALPAEARDNLNLRITKFALALETTAKELDANIGAAADEQKNLKLYMPYHDLHEVLGALLVGNGATQSLAQAHLNMAGHLMGRLEYMGPAFQPAMKLH